MSLRFPIHTLFMQRLRSAFRSVQSAVRWLGKQLQQFYTVRELRAIGLFVAVGLAVVVYRGGRTMYYQYYPARLDPAGRTAMHRQDSLFAALSRVANMKDSLFFSLPEDSLLPNSEKRKMEHHSKAEGLRPKSISLNGGSKEDLMRLPGVGPATAERIMEYRSERKHFRSLGELTNIKGFGKKHLESVRKYIRLN